STQPVKRSQGRAISAFFITASKSTEVAPALVQRFKSLYGLGTLACRNTAFVVVFAQTSFCHFSPAASFCIQRYAVESGGNKLATCAPFAAPREMTIPLRSPEMSIKAKASH